MIWKWKWKKMLLSISAKYSYFKPIFNYTRKGLWKGILICWNCDTLMCFCLVEHFFQRKFNKLELHVLRNWGELLVLLKCPWWMRFFGVDFIFLKLKGRKYWISNNFCHYNFYLFIYLFFTIQFYYQDFIHTLANRVDHTSFN